eukprot:6589423-Alexandrium_andersonii.AAC.1
MDAVDAADADANKSNESDGSDADEDVAGRTPGDAARARSSWPNKCSPTRASMCDNTSSQSPTTLQSRDRMCHTWSMTKGLGIMHASKIDFAVRRVAPAEAWGEQSRERHRPPHGGNMRQRLTTV